jgi:hypothetical protein
MTPEVAKQIDGKSSDEIKKMIKSNEIEVPKDPKELEEFLLEASKKPEDRKSTTETQSEVSAPAAPAIPEEANSKASETSIADNVSDPWWKKEGYESEEELAESHKKLRNLNNQLRLNLDSLNSKEGMRGRQLKTLKEEREKLLKEVDELKKKVTPAVEKPVKPVKPLPKDFELGREDDAYLEALDKWQDDLAEYSDKMGAYVLAENEKKIAELKPVEVESVQDDIVDVKAAWDVMYDQDIPAFQKKYGLETSVSIRDISEANRRKDTAFIETVPKKDMERYIKISDLCEKEYDFTTGAPIPYHKVKKLEGCAFEYDLIGYGKPFNITKPVSLTAEEELKLREQREKQNNETVATVPANKNISDKDPVSGELTTEESKKRYKDLLTEFNVAIRSGNREVFKSSEKYNELVRIGHELKMPTLK